ncbi:MAG: hypothetical protein ACE147_00765 [Candidatus Methylomirabilales bacterium]
MGVLKIKGKWGIEWYNADGQRRLLAMLTAPGRRIWSGPLTPPAPPAHSPSCRDRGEGAAQCRRTSG